MAGLSIREVLYNLLPTARLLLTYIYVDLNAVIACVYCLHVKVGDMQLQAPSYKSTTLGSCHGIYQGLAGPFRYRHSRTPPRITPQRGSTTYIPLKTKQT